MHSKKKIAGLALGAVALTGTGVAYAYWTTTGTGSGTATAGQPVTTDVVTIAQSAAPIGLYPGAAPADISVTATNPAAFDQFVGAITAIPAYPSTCDSSNWTYTAAANSIGLLGKGATSAVTKVGTLKLDETGKNQDGCKTAQVTFKFTSAGDTRTVPTN